nr:MAG TPA: Large polyvalent protein associated domain 38 [Caudoviricetes sp.]
MSWEDFKKEKQQNSSWEEFKKRKETQSNSISTSNDESLLNKAQNFMNTTSNKISDNINNTFQKLSSLKQTSRITDEQMQKLALQQAKEQTANSEDKISRNISINKYNQSKQEEIQRLLNSIPEKNDNIGVTSNNTSDINQRNINSNATAPINKSLFQKVQDFAKEKEIIQEPEKGNILQNVGGSLADIGLNFTKGILDVPENLSDLYLHGIALGKDIKNNNINSIANELLNAKPYGNYSTLSQNNLKEDSQPKTNVTDMDIYNSIHNKREFSADELRNFASNENYYNLMGLQRVEDKVNNYSYLGNTSDEVFRSIGYTAGMAVISAPLSEAIGLSSSGDIPINLGSKHLDMPILSLLGGSASSLNETYQSDKSNGTKTGLLQTWIKAINDGLTEGFTEGMFGMYGVGGSSLEDKTQEFIKNKIAKGAGQTLASLGMSAFGEASEEFVSYALNYMDNHSLDTMFGTNNADEWNWEDVGKSMASAFASTLISQGSIQTIKSIANKFNSNTLYNNAIVLAEQQLGRKLNSYEKSEVKLQIQEIQKQVSNNLESKTEETKDTKINRNDEQVKNLIDILNASTNLQQNVANNQSILSNRQITQADNKIVQNGISVEANEMLNNNQLPMLNYQYENSNNEKINNLRQDANKYFNNSEKARNYVNMLEQIIKDKNVDIRLDANLKTPDGIMANGSYSNGVITINPNSTKAGEFIAVHELTHAIGNDSMRNIIETYRKSNTEFNAAVENLLQNYDSTELTDEALSDVSAQLFGNQEFINNVSQKSPNIFKRIYNEIKYLWHQFRGYKNQDQFIDDLYYKWTQVYNNNNKLNEASNYSIAGKQGMKNAIKADTSNLVLERNYNKAQQMQKNGVDNETIRQSTGWFQDRNGDWKFELSDKDMSLKNIKLEKNKTYELGNLLEHDTLFTVYPQLKNIEIQLRELNGANGKYSVSNNNIIINNKLIGNSPQIEGTLIHEIQHAIQNIEGFENGASSKKSKLAYFESLGEIEADDTKKRYLLEKNGKIDRNTIEPESSKNNPQHSKLNNYLKNRKLLDKIKDNIYNYSNSKNKKGGDNYEIYQEDMAQNNQENSRLVFAETNGNNRSDGTLGNSRVENGRKNGEKIQEIDKKIQERHEKIKESTHENEEKNNSKVWTNRILEESGNNSGSFSLQDNHGRELSKEQQEYFKDSKVRDENGNLMTVYHGTPYEFNQFKYDKLGENTSSLGAGFYFTDKQSTAEEYKRDGGNIKEVYLDIKNPISYGKTTITKKEFSKFVNAVNKKTNGILAKDYGDIQYAINEYDYGGDDIDLVSSIKSASGLSWEELYETLRDSIGKDGIISNEGFLNNGEKIYVAFNSNQIKNVDNTNPTGNPDIRYSRNNSKWQNYLEQNYKSEGTRTNLEEIKNRNLAPVANDFTNYKKLSKSEKKELFDYLDKRGANYEYDTDTYEIIDIDDKSLIKDFYITKYLEKQKNNNSKENINSPYRNSDKIANDNTISDLDAIREESRKVNSPSLETTNKTANKLTNNGNKLISATISSVNKQRRKENVSLSQIKDTLAQKFVNKGHYIDKLAKETGNKKLTYLYDRTMNAFNEAQISIGDKQIISNAAGTDIEVVGKSIIDIFSEADKANLSSEFDDYLLNKHNISRFAYEKGIFGSEVSATDSEITVNAYEKKYPKFYEWSKEVSKYNDNNLKDLVRNGLVSNETYNKLREMYSDYVPTFRDITESITQYQDDLVGNNTLKKATESDKSILSIKESMAEQTLAIKKAIRVNKLGVELYKTLGKESKVNNNNIVSGIEFDPVAIQSLAGDVIAKAKDGTNTFMIFQNGEMTEFKISDELYSAFAKDTLQNKINSSTVAKTLLTPIEKISNAQRELLTTYSIGFAFNNPIKDFQDAVFNTKYSSAQFLKNYTKALYNIGTDGSWYKNYKENGGTANTYFDYQKGILPNKNKRFGDNIKVVNEILEQAPRLAEYISTIENGGSIDEALYNAADITTNFKRGGNITKVVNKYGANFLNASVQGLDKFYRNLSGQNGWKGYANLAVKAIIWQVAPAILNGLLLGDDDDYDDLPEYTKDNYFLFKIGDGKFFRIPKGRISSVVGGIARRALETTEGKNVDWKALIDTTINQMAPNNPFKDNLIAPILQVKRNTAWYGGEIVSSRLQKLPIAEQSDESTDKLSKFLGEKLNISPKKINYVLDQYSGGIGDVILPMLTPQAENNILEDKFTTDSIMKNKHVSQYYSLLEDLEKNKNSEKATDEDKLKYMYLSGSSKELGELYQEKRDIQNSDLSDKEKKIQVRDIQKEINSIVEEKLENVDSIQKNGDTATIGNEKYYKYKGEWKNVSDEEVEKIIGLSLNTYANYQNKVAELLAEKKKENKTITQKDKIKILANSDYSSNEKDKIYSQIINTDDDTYKILNKLDNSKNIINQYLDYLQTDLKADREDDGTNSGKAVSGSKKQKVYYYINSIESKNMSYIQKLYLAGINTTLSSADKKKLFNLINESSSLSKSEKLEAFSKLQGFTVYKNGKVTW